VGNCSLRPHKAVSRVLVQRAGCRRQTTPPSAGSLQEVLLSHMASLGLPMAIPCHSPGGFFGVSGPQERDIAETTH
jgi:hypothetical protein